MKKKLFDTKIYLEGLRQTRVMGLFLMIATVVGSALAPLFSIMTSFTLLLFEEQSTTMVDLFSFAPFLGLFMFLGPILLSMHLFSFLNKRNGSDFYHALPCTRSCLFVSFSMSIVTWLAGTILTTTLVNGFLYTVCPTTNIHWAFIPYSFFTYFCGSLLVLAVMLIAKSMTGTGLSNIVVAILIGFGPRALTMIFVSVLTEMVPVLDASSMGFFMNTAYNIPVNMVLGIGTIDNTSFSFIPGMITTVALALLYFVFAWLLFKNRKSETAQKSAPNKVMQHVIRCLITIPITLIVPITIVLEDVMSAFLSSFTIFVIAAVIYFGYELLSTRKAKNLLYALPVFGIVILFDILFGVALVGAKYAAFTVPDVSEIQSISVTMQDTQYDYFGNYEHYNMLLTGDYFIEDENMIQLVNNALEDTIEDIKENQYYEKLYGNYENTTYYAYPVSIKKKNGSVVRRNVLLRYDVLDEIFAVYEKDAGYREKLVQLPPKDSVQEIEFYEVGIDKESAQELWEIFSEEYASLSYEEQLLSNGIGSFYEGSQWDDTSLQKITFWVYGYRGITSYQANYSISANTPKTYQAYLEAVKQQCQESAALFFSDLEKIASGESGTANYDFYFQDCKGMSWFMSGNISRSGVESYSGTYEMCTYDSMKDVFSVLEVATKRPVDLNQPLYDLTVNGYELNSEDIDRDYSSYFTVYINLTEEELEVLKPYMDELSSAEIRVYEDSLW